ncbi:porin family protein [Flavobacterium sp. Fl-77]|uniref:Porin family protein n=1 Tax=Flavobacterium flavipigmentatum TaxID=2893884 RepID=A0AAJ2SEM7_9FLAO|nr:MULTISPECIES: porin family protein [unclassified Flavobacterium]MDX6182457.1 porin family protein [Flavobacterium sp. Fl-33]MDX6185630.1 porin family protein [Flavobacterium sp. Fl-77]UFH38815.1 PorT family protein [Flavobacterium sp. F-70]
MKRIILTAVAVISFAFANAQSTRFGIKGGLNIATIGNAENAEALVGFQLGGFAEINVWKKLFVQPELLFSTQGARIDNYGNAADYTVNLNYINIPVLAKYYITKTFSVEAGPQIGLLVSSENIDDERTVDAAFNIGGGYNFTQNFSVGIRYTVGLSNVYDNDRYNDGYYYDDRYTNNVLALTAAYKF